MVTTLHSLLHQLGKYLSTNQTQPVYTFLLCCTVISRCEKTREILELLIRENLIEQWWDKVSTYSLLYILCNRAGVACRKPFKALGPIHSDRLRLQL